MGQKRQRPTDPGGQGGDGLRVDAVFGFNLGLTCPDYDWGESAAALARDDSPSSSVTAGKPLVMITNTLMELMMDREYLEEEHGVALVETPCKDRVEEEEEEEEEEQQPTTKKSKKERKREKKIARMAKKMGANMPMQPSIAPFPSSSSSDDASPFAFGLRNPFAWIPWRQSGTLGNDVYRKNSHIGAGLIASSLDSLVDSSSSSSSSSYLPLFNYAHLLEDDAWGGGGGGDGRHQHRQKKKRRKGKKNGGGRGR